MKRLLEAVMVISAGALAPIGFAPYGFWPAPVLSLAILFLAWHRAGRARRAAGLGFCWGLGYFVSGIHWIEISLHDFGGMPLPLALAAIGLFSAFLGLFPATVGALTARFADRPVMGWVFAIPALWTLSEWARGWFLTGFPWLSLGYSQTPQGPFSGIIPVLGVFGASLMVCQWTGTITLTLLCLQHKRPFWKPALGALVYPLVGIVLGLVVWTHPQGNPLMVNLLQGNIDQNLKFARESRGLIQERYNNLLFNSSGRLILMPESALPYIRQELPEIYTESLERFGYQNDSDLLVGLFSEPAPGKYYNSVFSFGHSPSQSYQKTHLVPFGEFIPWSSVLKPLIRSVLSIPIDSQQRGQPDQQPLRVAGQRVAVDICYEDAFGEEVIRQLPQATLLANFSNDAWFGDSIGPEQHLQMAQTRALETGRPLLRVTNTGVTALIDPQGRLMARAPRGEIFNLSGQVQGYSGATPFVRIGNSGILAVCILFLVLSLRLRL